LMRTSWGPDFDGDPNILEVYIGYLRKKFVAVASNATIKTIRGLGYCVVTE
jgi:DNA-binding response OmpR family regulator